MTIREDSPSSVSSQSSSRHGAQECDDGSEHQLDQALPYNAIALDIWCKIIRETDEETTTFYGGCAPGDGDFAFYALHFLNVFDIPVDQARQQVLRFIGN